MYCVQRVHKVINYATTVRLIRTALRESLLFSPGTIVYGATSCETIVCHGLLEKRSHYNLLQGVDMVWTGEFAATRSTTHNVCTHLKNVSSNNRTTNDNALQ